MDTMTGIHQTTIASARRKLAAGELRSADLMAAVLRRARESEPAVHAYCFLDEEAAMRAAEEADRAAARGDALGPLHGIPFGAKDLYSTADMPTEAGSEVLAGNRPQQDAYAVAELRAAGAILVGKQHTHEFGFGLDEPPTRNAWDTARYPGGSTAGGAVSTAVGSCLFALGTDGGGSIRKPASLNGCVGLKPTLGSISTAGILPGTTSADHVGWITRSVQDAVLLWSVFSGKPAVADPRGPLGRRLGCPSFFFRGIDPAIESAVRDALAALERAGATLVDLEIPELDQAAEAHGVIVSAESYQLHKAWVAELPGLYHPANLQSLRAAARITERQIDAAERQRTAIRAAVGRAMDEYRLDALCGPTVAIPPAPLDGMDPGIVLPHYIRLTAPYNLTGQPAISVPCGLDGHGLPVGLQIAARPHREDTVLAIARQVEESGIWAPERPLGAVRA